MNGSIFGQKTRKAEANRDMMIAQKIQFHCLAVGPQLQLKPHAGCPEMGVANRLLQAGLLYRPMAAGHRAEAWMLETLT